MIYALSSPASEHYLLEMELEIPVGVFESEPSSIIACALSCQKYRSELEKRQQAKLLSEQEMRSQGTSGRTTPTQYAEYTGDLGQMGWEGVGCVEIG